MRHYIFCVLQATAALDEKSKLEKSLKDLQMIQGDQKVNISSDWGTNPSVLHYCPCWSVWYVSFLAGTKLQVSIVLFLQALSHSCCSVSQQIMQSAGLLYDIGFVSNRPHYILTKVLFQVLSQSSIPELILSRAMPVLTDTNTFLCSFPLNLFYGNSKTLILSNISINQQYQYQHGLASSQFRLYKPKCLQMCPDPIFLKFCYRHQWAWVRWQRLIIFLLLDAVSLFSKCWFRHSDYLLQKKA